MASYQLKLNSDNQTLIIQDDLLKLNTASFD